MNNNYWTTTDPANTPTSELIKQARELFENVYIYDEENIDTQFPAPEKDITISFLKSYEPDAVHLGKSYDDFIAEKDKTYMTMRQYLILAMYVWKTEQKHLDEKGWTRTSSLWYDGRLVSGSWFPGDSELDCSGGRRDDRDADGGPREVRILEPLSYEPFKLNNKELSPLDHIDLLIAQIKDLQSKNKRYKEKMLGITELSEQLDEIISNE